MVMLLGSCRCCNDPAGGNVNCAQSGCHVGPQNTPVQSRTGWITSNIPSSGYAPGTTYTITAIATGTSSYRYGFEVSPQNSNGTVLGSLVITDGVNTQLAGSNNGYITHKTAGTVGTTGSHTWSFNWTAPTGANSDSVTFYGAFNISNSDNTAAGDTIRTSILTVRQNPAMGIATITNLSNGITTFPNPVNNFITIINNTDSEKMQLVIFNTDGQTVKELQQVTSNQPVNLADLPSGYYVLKIITTSGISIQKFIKN